MSPPKPYAQVRVVLTKAQIKRIEHLIEWRVQLLKDQHETPHIKQELELLDAICEAFMSGEENTRKNPKEWK